MIGWFMQLGVPTLVGMYRFVGPDSIPRAFELLPFEAPALIHVNRSVCMLPILSVNRMHDVTGWCDRTALCL